MKFLGVAEIKFDAGGYVCHVLETFRAERSGWLKDAIADIFSVWNGTLLRMMAGGKVLSQCCSGFVQASMSWSPEACNARSRHIEFLSR